MIKVERNLAVTCAASTSLNAVESADAIESIALIAREWLEADRRNLCQLRHVQEDRICACLQSLNQQDLVALKAIFSEALCG